MNKTALTECNRRWAARVDLQTHIKTNTPIINSELTFFPSDLLEIVAYAIQTNPLDKNGSLGVCNLNLAMHHRVAEIEEYLENGEKKAKKYWYKNMMRVPLRKAAEAEDAIREKRTLEGLKKSPYPNSWMRRWHQDQLIRKSSSTTSANSIANEFNVDRFDPMQQPQYRGGTPATSSESDTMVQRPFTPCQYGTPPTVSIMDVSDSGNYYGEGMLRLD